MHGPGPQYVNGRVRNESILHVSFSRQYIKLLIHIRRPHEMSFSPVFKLSGRKIWYVGWILQIYMNIASIRNM
jgi:hypothetical protein